MTHAPVCASVNCNVQCTPPPPPPPCRLWMPKGLSWNPCVQHTLTCSLPFAAQLNCMRAGVLCVCVCVCIATLFGMAYASVWRLQGIYTPVVFESVCARVHAHAFEWVRVRTVAPEFFGIVCVTWHAQSRNVNGDGVCMCLYAFGNGGFWWIVCGWNHFMGTSVHVCRGGFVRVVLLNVFALYLTIPALICLCLTPLSPNACLFTRMSGTLK